MKTRLSPYALNKIRSTIDLLFNKAKIRVLGPQSVDKRVAGHDYKEPLSLPGIFTSASYEEYTKPDENTLKTILTGAANFIDSYREATKAQVIKRVDSFLRQAETSGVDTDLETVLGGQLADVWKKTTTDMHRLIDTEAQNCKSMGALDGIIRVNAAHDIEDPVVYKVVVRDQHLCETCKRLHMLEDGITPRLWYLSELHYAYGKKTDTTPTLGPQHPHCRCSVVTLMPGFGFNSEGFVAFKGLQYNAIDEQRRAEKSESVDGEPLAKDVQDQNIWWHGSPSGDLRGGISGLHIGTRKAAEEALHARIGYPAEGSWDGTREYGKTLLAGGKTLRARGISCTGYNCSSMEEDHYPSGKATYSDGSPVLSEHRPNIFPVKIVGLMTNTVHTPHSDVRANALMSGMKKRGVGRRGFYYRNEGEDYGSVSAVVPGPDHVQVLDSVVKSESLAKFMPESAKTFDEGEEEWNKNGEKYHPWARLATSAGGAKYLEPPADKDEEGLYWARIKERRGRYPHLSDTIHPDLVKAFKTAPITINFPEHVIKKLARSGRFYNLGKAKDGMGCASESVRKKQEERVFGICCNKAWTRRPVYGSLHYSHETQGLGNTGGAESYGRCWATLKPHVRSRSSFTHSDSFDVGPEDVFTEKHLDKLAHHWAINEGHFSEYMHKFYSNGRKEDTAYRTRGFPYVEAQIHGGVSLKDDVESLHCPPLPAEEKRHLISLGKKYGIKVIEHKVKYSDEDTSSTEPNSWIQTVLYNPLSVSGSLKKAEPLPIVVDRQQNDYSCGPASLAAVLNYFGREFSDLSKALKTDPVTGTSPEALERKALESGLYAQIKEQLTVADLRAFVAANEPVIVAYQAHGKQEQDLSKSWDDGHYSVVVGVDDGSVYLQDPSSDSGTVEIPIPEFEGRWHDRSGGREYVCAGVVFSDSRIPFRVHTPK